MKRKEKYPETQNFVYFNANPKNRITGDCAFRAVALATGSEYNSVVMAMAQTHCKTGYALNDKKGIDNFLKSIGWSIQSQIRKPDNKKYTGAEFCRWLSINYPNAEIGNVIANIGGHHIVCIKPTNSGEGINCRYKIHDTWDSSQGCVGNYWIVRKNRC